mmetsp:Transcript_36931/g.51523  ORF Transcript_36931/g.51523 Transcript_36931/m.51523 type:complete len:862 (-) Transcript_36931:147-2732(-)
MGKSWFSQLYGHKLVRNTSDWVVRHTNSRTVVVWLCIDLFISLGLGTYYFLFRYVSSLGWVPLQMMNNFKFYVLVAGIRAACTLWGIASVLRRNVRHVKLYYTVFLLNLLVAVWLMVPILSMDCHCTTNYYQCEAIQSFALDGVSLNKIPPPKGHPARKVPYAQPPENSVDLSLADAGVKNDSESFASSSSTTAPSTTATATESASKEDQQAVDDAKQLAAATQQPATPPQGGALLGLGQGLLAAAEPGQNEVEMLDDLLSSGHPRLVEKKRRRWKAPSLMQAPSLLQLEDPSSPGGQYVQSPAVTGQLQQQQVLPQQPMVQNPAVQPQQWVQVSPNPQGPISPNQPGQIQYYQQPISPNTPLTPVQAVQPQQMVQVQPVQGQPVSPTYTAAVPAAVVTHETPIAATTATTTGTTTPAVSEDEAAEKKTKAAYDTLGNNFKVLTYFDRVSDKNMIKSESADGVVSCKTEPKQKEQRANNYFQMDELVKGTEVSNLDDNVQEVLRLCVTEESCFGIRWKLEEVKKDELYNSTVCMVTRPASVPNKSPEETKDGIRTFYLTKNDVASREYMRDPRRRESLIAQIMASTSTDDAVERTKEFYDLRCRCDEKSCRSYTDTEGREKSWCFLEEKTIHRCHAKGYQVFEDPDTKKKWSRDVCHKADTYEESCRCSDIGMVPSRGSSGVNQELLSGKEFQYGSFCEKWQGDQTPAKECFVGWDSPCVDRRVDTTLASLYEDDGIPAQYWSMVACDDSKGARLKNASDACENLEYVADVVCLIHLFLSMPMVAVLYNFISNQCGDDFQMESQFAVQSSSSDEDDDNDEFLAGKSSDKAESETAGDDAAVPKFAGENAAAKPDEAKESSF